MMALSAARLATMSPTGRFVAIRQKHGVEIVDALGTSPRMTITLPGISDFAFVGNELWAVAAGTLHRLSPSSGKAVGATAHVSDDDSGRLLTAQNEQSRSALWRGGQTHLVSLAGSDVLIDDVDVANEVFIISLGGRRMLLADDKVIQVRDGSQALATTRLPNGGSVVGGGSLMGGRALGVLASADGDAAMMVLRPSGAMVHTVPLPPARRCAIAEARGVALVATNDGALIAVDLRFGRVLAEAKAPIPVDDLAIDVNGKYVTLAGFREDDTLAVLHLSYAELFGIAGARSAEHNRAKEEPEDAGSPDAEPSPSAEEQPVEPQRPIVVPDTHLAGLGRPPTPSTVRAPPGTTPYRSAVEHLDELLELVGARVARAITDAWDSGRLSLPTHDERPFQSEVFALTGGSGHNAQEELAAADLKVTELSARVGRRQSATLAAGRRVPFVEIADEFALSNVATRVLLLVAAPSLRGEIARLYGILANDEARPICDRHLVQVILAGNDRALSHRVAAELDSDAPLVRHGLVRVGAAANDFFLFAPLAADPVLLARLRGDDLSGDSAGSVTSMRHGTPNQLTQLALPEELKRDLVLAMTRPAPPDRPVRLVLRGRRGAGRRATMAALAARAGRSLAVINAERLPRQGVRFAAALRIELMRAGLRGAVPCISEVEVLDTSDAEGLEAVRSVIRGHGGPVLFRTSPEHKPPIDPGYLDFTIPPLSETARVEFWRTALARRSLVAAGADELGARFRIGPGTIETVIDNAVQRRDAEPEPAEDATADLDAAARQHIDTRLGNVATHLTRLARWEQVALPDDVLDSIREFLSRVKHRRKVYEEWGYDARMLTSRGLTALFHGPPGTGKSMVAGLIARELALDLYRVDLAQITSKWIGETEKNLSEVFDAAEDGQCVILFDEADSLFAKRTEVKSSVDRYANLEVNYLLQRLDTFEGVAILTTNLEGSLDQAFKRRLSLRLAFPFPDEEMRVRLWLAHIPPEVPTAGDFDFEDLARRFPLSGGYIRNSALRAAFLAAQEGVSLSQQHMLRAIHLEYREMGKLAPGGRLE